jgi:protein SCO1/2
MRRSMGLSAITMIDAAPSALRRRLLQATVALSFGTLLNLARADTDARPRDAARSSHFPFGPVVPARLIPAWQVITQRGQSTNLAALLAGRVTALQLMFTGCTATCPIQGALFAQAQHALPRESDFQLISISIAPLADTPAALSHWLRDFEAGPEWLGVAPRAADLDKVFELLAGGGERRPIGPDPHTGQVYIANRRGELVYRTPSMPPAAQIVAALREVEAGPRSL